MRTTRIRQRLLGRAVGSPIEVPLGVVLNADLLRGQSARVGYVGWIGRGNLGDDLLLELYRRSCPEIHFRYLSEELTPRILRALDRLNPSRVVSATVIGGGTIIGQALFRPLVEGLLKVYPEAPVSAIGVGVEDEGFPHSSDNHGELANWKPLLERFRAIGVRGPMSQAALRDLGIDAPIVGDTGLIAASYRPGVEVRPRLLGMNISHTPYPGVHGLQEAVRILTDFLSARVESGWRVRLFVFGESEHIHLRSHLNPLIGQKGVEIIDGRIDLTRLLARIAECQVFVGHRLHSVVLATAMGVPSVSIEYLPKCRDFQASVGRERFALPMSELSIEALSDMTDYLAANWDAEVRRIEAAVGRILGALRDHIDAFTASRLENGSPEAYG